MFEGKCLIDPSGKMLEGTGKLFSPTKMKLSDSADRNLAVPAMKRLGSLRKKPAFQSK